MTQKEQSKSKAVNVLKSWGVVDGTPIYAKVAHVSKSGMSRNIQLVVIRNNHPVNISYWAAKAMAWPYKDGYNGGVRAGGCGMDMLLATVDALSYEMGYGACAQTEGDITRRTENKQAIGLFYKQL